MIVYNWFLPVDNAFLAALYNAVLACSLRLMHQNIGRKRKFGALSGREYFRVSDGLWLFPFKAYSHQTCLPTANSFIHLPL